MHVSKSDIGMEIPNYGKPNEQSVSDAVQRVIRTIQIQDEPIACLLSAVLNQLSAVLNQLKSVNANLYQLKCAVREGQNQEPCLSEGMLTAFKTAVSITNGDIEITPEMQRKLSVKGRNTLTRANIRFLCEITKIALVGIRGCGQTTIIELMKFKDEYSEK